MRNTPKPFAKIICHSEGLGTPNSDLVRRRAEELARIDGRKEYNEEDWRQAVFELHGHNAGNSEDQENEMVFSGHDMLVYDPGHRVEHSQVGPDNVGEELVSEGIEEAVHEQMLQASQSAEEEEPEE
jgi:hypothetical protein